jgi:hypothetical protein
LTTDAARLVRFTIRLEGDEDERTIHSLRRLMKVLCRRYGLRCVSVREELMDDHEVEAPERSNDAVPHEEQATGKA